MIRPEIGAYLAIVSGGRPENVAPMTDLVGPATWYVSRADADAYHSAAYHYGAEVRIVDRPFPAARNEALRDAWALVGSYPCAMLDDDLVWARRCYPGSDAKPVEIVPVDALWGIVARVGDSPFHMGGASPTVNAYFSRHATTTRGFVRSGVLVVEESEPRIDERFRLKSDYDFTVQHVVAYGGVVRCDDLLFNFKQRTNKGGVRELRDQGDANGDAVRLLRSKWGDLVRPNPRRDGEVLLRFPRIPREVAT